MARFFFSSFYKSNSVFLSFYNSLLLLFYNQVQKLAAAFLRPYVWIAVGRVGSTVENIEQRLILAPADKREKLKLAAKALAECDGRTLVFVQKKRTAVWLKHCLRRGGPGDAKPNEKFSPVLAEDIHGDRSQPQREAALKKFREGSCKVLVATDVAARGLDIGGVQHVINFDLPLASQDFDSYVHRIGRTGELCYFFPWEMRWQIIYDTLSIFSFVGFFLLADMMHAGRAGHQGLATSLYVSGFCNKNGNGPIANQIMRQMEETGSEVPDWFKSLPETGAGSAGGKRKDKFGGRDVRDGDGSRGGKRQEREAGASGGGGSAGRGRSSGGGKGGGRGRGTRSTGSRAGRGGSGSGRSRQGGGGGGDKK